MQSNPPISPGKMIKQFRINLRKTQSIFAKEVGSTQSLISKYESGVIDPPASIIIHCMNNYQQTKQSPEYPLEDAGDHKDESKINVPEVSEETLIQLIQQLSGPENAPARQLLVKLIPMLTRDTPKTM